MPSPPSQSTGFPLTNGHLSPLAASVTNADNESHHSDSELSDVKEAIAEDVSSSEEAQEDVYNGDEQGFATSDSSEDVDAEGEPDGDYDSETPPPVQRNASRARTSTSEESRRSSKRKASVDYDDISQNPDLYGLRRSVRSICLLLVGGSLIT